MQKSRRFLPLKSCQNTANFPPPKAAENSKAISCVSSINKTQNIVLYIMIRFYYTKFLALCQHFWHFFCPKNTILCTLLKKAVSHLSAMHKSRLFFTDFLPFLRLKFHTVFAPFFSARFLHFSASKNTRFYSFSSP